VNRTEKNPHLYSSTYIITSALNYSLHRPEWLNHRKTIWVFFSGLQPNDCNIQF